MPGWIIAVAALVALQGNPQSPVQGRADTRTWYQAYSDGRRLAEAGNWQAAISSLELAKRTGPNPGRNVTTYGDNFINFNPDYYLGLAYLNTRRFAEADDAFQRVLKQPALITARDKEYQVLQSQSARAAYERQMAIADQELSAGRYDTAEQAVGRAKARATSAEMVRIDAFVADLQQRRNAPPAKVATGPAPTQTAPPADNSKSAQPPGPVDDSGTKQPSPGYSPSNTAAPAPVPPVSTAAGGAGRAGGNPLSNTAAGYKSTSSASSSLSKLSAVVLPVYAGGEETGMRYFFEGNYDAAVSLFESRVIQNNVSRATYFYLALSQTALVLAGQADRNVLAAARNYYVMADVAGAPDLTAALRYVSPRIRAELERQP